MHAGANQVLLLFKKGASRAISSPHDGEGELHLAFAIQTAELANWESWLQTKGVAVERSACGKRAAGAFIFETRTGI
jgi:hypothetical protein